MTGWGKEERRKGGKVKGRSISQTYRGGDAAPT